MPCHHARIIPGLEFPNVRDGDRTIREIWYESDAFNHFRGDQDQWMKEPCRSCPEKVKDYGGCRCQAYLMTGDAANADPVCDKSPLHGLVTDAIERARTVGATSNLFFRDDANSLSLAGGKK